MTHEYVPDDNSGESNVTEMSDMEGVHRVDPMKPLTREDVERIAAQSKSSGYGKALIETWERVVGDKEDKNS